MTSSRYTAANSDECWSNGRAPMMSLREVVERYGALERGCGKPVPLSAFGLSARETENLFCGFDDDYHISRYLHFSRDDGEEYTISGEAATHVAIDEGVYSLL
jgi:hypothetical protein